MRDPYRTFGRLTFRYRYLVVLVWIVAAVAASRLLPSLDAVNNFNLEFVPATSPSQQANRLAEPFQGTFGSAAALNPPTAMIIAWRADRPLDAADERAVTALAERTRSIAGVELVRDEGASADGTARELLVVVTAGASQNEADGVRIVNAIRAAVPAVGPPSGLQMQLTGAFAASVDAAAAAPSNISRVTVLLVVVLLFVVYRALLAPLLTVVSVVVSLLLAEGIVAALVSAGLLSGILINLLVVVLVGVGTDYGLFVAFRYREELTRTDDGRAALAAAVSRIGKVLVFSALTVALSLLVLLAAPFGIYRSAGVSFAVGIVVLLAAALTLTPALLAIAGRWAFWPARPSVGDAPPRGWGRLTERIIRRPGLTLGVGLVLLGALAAGLVGYRTSNAAPRVPPSSESAVGAARLAAAFPQASVGADSILLRLAAPAWDDPVVLERVQQRLAADPAFASIRGALGPGAGDLSAAQFEQLHTRLGDPLALPATLADPTVVRADLYERYRQSAQFISPDGRTLQYYAVLRAGPVGSAAAAAATPDAAAALATVARGVGAIAWGIAGEDPGFFDIGSVADQSTALVAPLVLLLILVLLAVLLRSLVAPVYLALTVGLSCLASLGFAMIAFVHLGGNPGLLFALPLLMFVFTMAVGEDYNILVISRIREELAASGSLREALVRAMGVTGATVTSAGTILAGTFVALGLVGGNLNSQELGFAIAFGVAMDTFVVRTVLVPSMVLMLGRWNWWPSRPADAR